MYRMSKQKVLILGQNLTYDLKNVKVKQNKLHVKRDYDVKFSPQSIFEENKAFWKFWRNPKRLMLLVDGQPETVKFETDKMAKDKGCELSRNWTSQETKEFIKKTVLKARMQLKAMDNMMFYILLILMIIIAFMEFMQSQRMGIF